VGKPAFIYSNIRIYRFCMNLLYAGKYYDRFDWIRKLIKGKKMVELCFGDTIIADFCRKNNIAWTGYDINPVFVENAASKGFDANLMDVNLLEKIASADVCLIAGSLYHFHSDPKKLISKMLSGADQIIISEPVINLSDRKGIIGKLAKASANVNEEKQSFRYTERSLLKMLDDLSPELEFTYEIAGRVSKDMIIVINKK
jgi:hypothetical protein